MDDKLENILKILKKEFQDRAVVYIVKEIQEYLIQNNISKVKIQAAHDCYNDEDYYFGIRDIEIEGLDIDNSEEDEIKYFDIRDDFRDIFSDYLKILYDGDSIALEITQKDFAILNNDDYDWYQ